MPLELPQHHSLEKALNITFNANDALLIVDLQYDFLPDGALHVPEGNTVIPIINTLIDAANKGHAPIIASRDWHPTNHCSFHEQGGRWPSHCVQNTPGAQFHSDVDFPDNTIIINKAFKADHEAYSAFSGETADGQTLTALLKKLDIKRLIIGGLALDYCVKASCLDAIKAGFETIVVLDATKAINQEDGKEALKILTSFGVQSRPFVA